MPPSNRIISLLIDRHARVWLGTLDKGLGIVLPSREKILEFKYNPANRFSLSTGAIFDVFEDRDGGV
jgi:ligand-binding sensor domain-containing protein